jgi:hypothetical protein
LGTLSGPKPCEIDRFPLVLALYRGDRRLSSFCARMDVKILRNPCFAVENYANMSENLVPPLLSSGLHQKFAEFLRKLKIVARFRGVKPIESQTGIFNRLRWRAAAG